MTHFFCFYKLKSNTMSSKTYNIVRSISKIVVFPIVIGLLISQVLIVVFHITTYILSITEDNTVIDLYLFKFIIHREIIALVTFAIIFQLLYFMYQTIKHILKELY